MSDRRSQGETQVIGGESIDEVEPMSLGFTNECFTVITDVPGVSKRSRTAAISNNHQGHVQVSLSIRNAGRNVRKTPQHDGENDHSGMTAESSCFLFSPRGVLDNIKSCFDKFR